MHVKADGPWLKCMVRTISFRTISTCSRDKSFTHLFKYFPRILGSANYYHEPVKHPVRYMIQTTGQSVAERPWRLPPDRLKVAKDELQLMQLHLSKSSGMIPLHIILKKKGDEVVRWLQPSQRSNNYGLLYNSTRKGLHQYLARQKYFQHIRSSISPNSHGWRRQRRGSSQLHLAP